MSWFSNWLSRPPRFQTAAEEYLSVSLAKCCLEMQKYTRYRMERYVYPFIGQQRIHRITPMQIIRCIQTYEQDAPSQARRLLQVVSGVYRYAKVQGWCRYNPAEGLGIALKPYTYKGFSFIPPQDMPEFLAAVDTHTNIDAAALTAFWLIVYTAVRRGEAVNAALSEFDFATATWTIPAARMKMRRPHVVPLAPDVVDLLSAWLVERARRGISGDLLFGGIGGHRPLHVITQAGWRDKMTIHGFRKVFSTHAHESGLWSVDAIELQLAHIISGVRGVYNKAMLLDERRQLMIWYADEINRWRAIGRGGYNDS